MNGIRWFFLLLIAPFMLAACSSQSSDDQYVEPISIRLAMTMQPSSALSIIAAEKGLFKKYGLTVTFTEFPSGKRALRDGLLAGKADVAFSSDVPIVSTALSGKPIHVIATTFMANDVNRIVARKDHGITSPGDLRGKRVATQRASAVHFFLSLFLSENGLASTDIHASYMKAEELPAALAAGSIDAFSMREPYVSEAVDLLGDRAVVFSAPGLYQQFDAVVVEDSFYRNNAKAIERLLKALLAAESYAAEHPKESIAVVAGRLGASESSIEPLWNRYTLKLAVDQSYLLLLESISRWMLNAGVSDADGTISPEYLKIIDTDPLERIDPNRITLIR